jgi:hypothetical protein
MRVRVCPQVTAASRLWCSSPDSFSAPSSSIWSACRRRCSRLTATQVSENRLDSLRRLRPQNLLTLLYINTHRVRLCVRMTKKSAGCKKLLWCQPSRRIWNFSGALNGARFGCIESLIVCVCVVRTISFSLCICCVQKLTSSAFSLWESELHVKEFPRGVEEILLLWTFHLFTI